MKSLRLKRNLLIFASYVIAGVAQIFCLLHSHSFEFFSFISLVILNACVVESIKNDFDGRIYIEENYLVK
jgi:hypothetical protein